MSQKLTGHILMEGHSEAGIMVDHNDPNRPWHDMVADIIPKGVGANNPVWTTYRGVISQYLFDVDSEVWLTFHVPHDYKKGTDLYIHVHWSHNSTEVTGGSITFNFNASYAKGHNQAAFIAPVTASVTQNASTTQYQHLVGEVQLSDPSPSAGQLDTDDIEVDGLILVRGHFGANNITSSGAVPDIFVHTIDIHYQSTDIGTKNKAPNFYT